MADPVTLIGLVASVVQLVQTGATVCNYLNDVKNASEEQRGLSHEFNCIGPLLEELQKRMLVDLSNPNDPRVIGMQRLEESLSDCKKKMEKLSRELEPSRVKKFWKRLTWTWYKNEIKDTIITIGRFKSMLSEWLLIDLWNIGQKLERGHDSEERRKVIQWLSPLNFFMRQDDIFSRRQEGTGGWLLESDEFKTWISDVSGALWCRGMPGSGKTVLSSIVVDYLRKQFGDGAGIAAIYCNYKDITMQTPVNLIASLWMQLVQGRPLFDKVKNLYKTHVDRDTRPSLGEISEVLRSEIGGYSESNIFIIVDALDECLEENAIRATLLRELCALQPAVHLMVTSRPNVTIEPDLPCSMQVEVLASDGDVRRYVDARISRDRQLARHLKGRSTLQEDICKTVVSNAQGMFLLAQLHMDSLATKTTPNDVLNALRILPKGLDETCDEAMKRVYDQNNDHRILAQRVLSWVSHAVRPLSAEELRHALAVKPGFPYLDEDSCPDNEIFLSVCAGLITVDSTSNAVSLVHYTPQKYFERTGESHFPDAHTEIARRCLIYLSFDIFADVDIPADWQRSNMKLYLRRNILLGYAARYWMSHAQAGSEFNIKDLITQLLEQESKLTFSLVAKWTSEVSTHTTCMMEELPVSAFHFARYGLPETLGRLLESIECVECVEGIDPGRALREASWGGHEQVVQLLLEKGADINIEGSDALEVASSMGHERVVRLLLEKGVNVNAQNALEAASRRGHEQVVQLLLDGGADVNAGGGSALQKSSYIGHEQVVLLLLEKGADVNIQGGKYGNALQAASCSGNEWVVQLLLKKGADVHVQGGEYGNALQAASYSGNVEVVQLLLKKGADVNVQGEIYGNALQAASNWRHEQVVQLLLEKGADLHVQEGKYGNALQAASYGGQTQVVLLGGGDVNTHGGEYGNASQAAFHEGQPIQFVPEGGRGPVILQTGENDNLEAASYTRHKQVVQLLLEKGADVTV